ncbi:MAG TPA: PEP-CTERM sorting domain-containing protein [Aliidongia sp.]|uniref:PEP-CTERM sorting domain-containing protein n=1 Tax=Aliidongia sp. TaxID=1914230 RepID=UPI002DDD0483|nr:PEP-CTERM sorting domain-containing protein [Aliidongia sp.]HEV2677135.1 PEP-CTERM sorting domain-containing protein [Aliidongia sp.]
MASRFPVLIIGAMLLLTGHSAKAGLIGDVVGVQYFYPSLDSLYQDMGTQTVGSGGVLFAGLGGAADLTVDDTTLMASFDQTTSWTGTTFNGFVLTDFSNPLPAITIDPATTLVGLTDADLSVSGNTFALNWAGLSFSPDTVLILDVANVPEPAALPLVCAGLVGLSRMRRRRRHLADGPRLADPFA